MARHHPHLNLWQWNCRGFRAKRSTLQLHLQNIPPDTAPSVLALQEPLSPVKLRDYTAFHPSSEAHPNVATLVHRNFTAVLHQLDVSDCAHLLLEILPRRRTEASLFVLHVYSPPKAPSAPLLFVLRKALSCAGRNALLILGDFNAPHTSWGYPQNTRKGHSLWNFIHNERLSILNDFTRPTRIGSSVQRDTNPDLALARNVADSSWSNTGISLGSDHYVLCTTFPLPSLARSSTRLAQVVDWDRFRSIRLSTSSSPITDLSAWTETILADVRTATSILPAAPHSTTADSRLLHLWEAYHAMHRRWQAQKHSRRLRLRLARLASDMEEHCSSLLRQQWGQTCDRMAGNLGLRDTWSLLRPFWTLSPPFTSDTMYMLTSPLSSPAAQQKFHTAHFLLLLSP
ncbi:hypothetical protein HPB50_010887 [Hyalomma asiaticum]|uniref:Uncharacterized protein n=1 Tax=Hyalomma asiaticum TaxID=266040 RepID=A0ACB7SX16_HYAAI|nr:hypothetical protein HPB50_010887 [Hyalomma asiaticum]